MGRHSQFTPAQEREAVLGVLTKRKTVSETCRELGITEHAFARWRTDALAGMEARLADKADRKPTRGRAGTQARRRRAHYRPSRVGERLVGKSIEAADVKVRTALGRGFVAEGAAPVAMIARVLRVSRQALYATSVTPRASDGSRVTLRLVAPPLPEEWQSCELSPATMDLEVALHVLARRHPVAGYRKFTSRLRRRGWLVNSKWIARLLRAWGFSRRRPKPHPIAQGRPFDITRPNEL